MADAGPGADSGEPGVGDERDVFAERQEFQRARELIGFLHARAHRSA